jgi:hypothetical protein
LCWPIVPSFVQGSIDADRLSALHVPVTQLNTDPGLCQGRCLDSLVLSGERMTASIGI